MAEDRSAFKILPGKSTSKEIYRKFGPKWEDLRIDLKETGTI